MKKLLILLFSLFLLNSPSVFADDISKFEIEGISIGDSLLDYMTEDEILKEIEKNIDRYSYLKEPYKYVQVNLTKEFRTYDALVFAIKNNSTNQFITNSDEKFTILYIGGNIHFVENFDSCKQKKDEIEEVLSGMFPNTKIGRGIGFKIPSDPSGESIGDAIEFKFTSGAEIELQCTNYEETFRIKKNWREGLTIAIFSEEIIKWLHN